MDYKIVFFGKEYVGKSTLVNLFFKGESLSMLLKNPLEPTFGVQTFISKISDNIGIFDLSGQEYNDIIQTRDYIFEETNIFIVIVDCTNPLKDNLEIIKDCIRIRNRKSSNAFIYTFFHKKDLLSEEELIKLDWKLIGSPIISHNLKLLSTSIKKANHQKEILTLMLEILRRVKITPESDQEVNIVWLYSLIFSLLDNNSLTFNELNQSILMEKSFLRSKLDHFVKNGFILKEKEKSTIRYALTEKGQQFSRSRLNIFNDTEEESPIDKIKCKDINLDAISIQELEKLKNSLIFGYLIMDNNGRILNLFEFEENLIKTQFNRDKSNDFDMELFSTYLIVIYNFSQHINLNLLNKLHFNRENLRINIFPKENLKFVLFSSYSLEERMFSSDLSEWMEYFTHTYASEINKFVDAGLTNEFNGFSQYSTEFFQKLTIDLVNKIQKKELIKRTDKISYYKDLYIKMEQIISFPPSISENEISSLRMQLFDALLNNNFHLLENIEIKLKEKRII